MNTIRIKDGHLSTDVYVQVEREIECPCGFKGTITLQLPEGVSFNTEFRLTNTCPECGKQLVIPYGHHYIENFRLLTKPIPN